VTAGRNSVQRDGREWKASPSANAAQEKEKFKEEIETNQQKEQFQLVVAGGEGFGPGPSQKNHGEVVKHAIPSGNASYITHTVKRKRGW
jgi:hypothetical protein